eukprot:jgi/Ulvmu1/425/UM001_0432.1
MQVVTCNRASRSCLGLGARQDACHRRNVKAAFESDKASNARPSDKHTNPSGACEHDSEENGLLPVHHPGSFPLREVHIALEDATVEEDDPFDPLRDGPLRYLGYANELGEAFAAWLPAVGVPASYATAIAYVLVDTYDKTSKAHSEARSSMRSVDPASTVDPFQITTLLTSERAVDTLLWQLLASVAIPGFTIHQVVWLVHSLLADGMHIGDVERMPEALAATIAALAAVSGQSVSEAAELVERMVPTMAGLAAIPMIVHPIDNAVHMLLNSTLRPYMKNVICDGARGREAGLEICEVDFSSSDEEPVGQMQGAAISSFDYGSCINSEDCSVVREYNRHSADAKSRDLKKALAKALLLTGPVAVVLLAAQKHF